MSEARAEVFARIRAALGDQPATAPVERSYRRLGEMAQAELVALLADRLTDYKASVLRASADSLADVIAAALERRGARNLVVPLGLPASWLAATTAVDWRPDTPDAPLTAIELDLLDGTITASALAIAETGTIVLDGTAGHGRRLLSLVPDYHLCVVHASAIVQTVPEALARLDATRAQTWISGPSATSDIELQRVEGVHGPRSLEVIIVE